MDFRGWLSGRESRGSFCPRKFSATCVYMVTNTCIPGIASLIEILITYAYLLYRRLKQRQEAVSELTTNGSPSVSMLRECILHLPDLERMLCSAYHKKVLQSCIHYIDSLDIRVCTCTCVILIIVSISHLYILHSALHHNFIPW
jgi:hypothetical protein